MTTLADIRTVKSRDQWLAELLALLAGAGFNAQSWQVGSVQRTILECFAYALTVLHGMVSFLSFQAFNETAEKEALTALAKSHYANDRSPSVATQLVERFTGAAIGPPHTVGAGSVVVADAAGRTFRNLVAFTVPASGTVDVVVEADVPGQAANVSAGTVTKMVTPLAGVTCSNLSISRLGQDEEKDEALRLKNSAKWSTLALVEAIDERYDYIARATLSNCRVSVDSSNPDGPGTLRLYVARSDGVASSGDATAINDAIAFASFGGPDSNSTPYHQTIPASATTINVVGTVFYSSTLTNATDCQAAVEQAIRDYVNAAPIGGYSYGGGANNIIDRDGLIDVVRDVVGVKKITIGTPAGDTAVPVANVAVVGSFTITYTAAS